MKSIQRMTLRLPENLARRLAACIPSDQRHQFVVDLLRRELGRESWELEDAAIRLSLLEKTSDLEDVEWLALDDERSWGAFDEKRFLKELDAKAAKPRQADPP